MHPTEPYRRAQSCIRNVLHLRARQQKRSNSIGIVGDGLLANVIGVTPVAIRIAPRPPVFTVPVSDTESRDPTG